jgi:excisionase family DNA binding protein
MTNDELVADGLFTIQESADFLGLGRTSIYALIADGTLPARKLGRCRRIPRTAVRELASRNRLNSISPKDVVGADVA